MRVEAHPSFPALCSSLLDGSSLSIDGRQLLSCERCARPTSAPNTAASGYLTPPGLPEPRQKAAPCSSSVCLTLMPMGQDSVCPPHPTSSPYLVWHTRDQCISGAAFRRPCGVGLWPGRRAGRGVLLTQPLTARGTENGALDQTGFVQLLP